MKQLARFLADSGVRHGDRVGVYMSRKLESAIAIYGIMKAGAVYVPLDPLSPSGRTSFLLQDCGIQHLVTTPQQKRGVRALLKEDPGITSIIGLSDIEEVRTTPWETIYSTSLDGYEPLKILEQDLAYIMYTSGTTGAPKGIMHTHYSGLSYARLSAELYDVKPTDRLANHAPLYFDISTFGYFSGPLAGACTVIIPDAYTKLPASLSELIEKEKLSIWYSVPLALIQLLTHGVLEKRKLDSLRLVLYGGENFAPKYIAKLMEHCSNARFCNVYGPSEVNQCTYHFIDTLPEGDAQIPIGKVWENTTYKILDENDNGVQEGEAGELVIRSATMMKGYWNNQKLTVASLYKEISNSGLENVYYRTGDLVKLSEEGALLFLGRNDGQVKIRGHRVEIGEVESVLAKHESVQEAVVVAFRGQADEKGLLAAVIPEVDGLLDNENMLEYCKRTLPPYAVPDEIYIMDNFPRTASDKIDRSEIKKRLINS